MERSAWLGKLEDLQDRYRRGEPLGDALGWYRESRAALVATALAEQAKRLARHERARRHLRVHQAVQVTFSAADWTAHSVTSDLAGGGFACRLDTAPPDGVSLQATLHLPDGVVVEHVSIVSARQQQRGVHASFAFDAGAVSARDRIETFLLDAVIEQLVFWDDVLNTMGVR